MVAAVELEDVVAPREPAGQPDGGGGGLGPGGDEAHLLDPGGPLADHLGQLDLPRRGGAEAGAVAQLLVDLPDHLDVGVAEDGRAPAAHVVDEDVPVDVEDLRALGPGDEERRHPHAPEGAHRAVHAAREEGLGLLEELLRQVGLHGISLVRPRTLWSRAASRSPGVTVFAASRRSRTLSMLVRSASGLGWPGMAWVYSSMALSNLPARAWILRGALQRQRRDLRAGAPLDRGQEGADRLLGPVLERPGLRREELGVVGLRALRPPLAEDAGLGARLLEVLQLEVLAGHQQLEARRVPGVALGHRRVLRDGGAGVAEPLGVDVADGGARLPGVVGARVERDDPPVVADGSQVVAQVEVGDVGGVLQRLEAHAGLPARDGAVAELAQDLAVGGQRLLLLPLVPERVGGLQLPVRGAAARREQGEGAERRGQRGTSPRPQAGSPSGLPSPPASSSPPSSARGSPTAASPPSPATATFSATRATPATCSSRDSTVMRRTPWVLRPMRLICPAGIRMSMPAVGDEHHLVGLDHRQRSHHRAVALGGLDGDDALAAAALDPVLGELGALAVAVLGDGEDGGGDRPLLRRRQRLGATTSSPSSSVDALHAVGAAAHRADLDSSGSGWPCPAAVAMRISRVPSVMRGGDELSPSSMQSAMMPYGRGSSRSP